MALDKIKTKDKLHSMGVTDDALCPLSTAATETGAHLFFDCPFSKLCLNGIRQWTGVRLKPISTMDIRKFKLNRFQKLVLCAIYTSTVYYIWKNMTDVV